ncbi:MAG: phage tail sheath C-terminal domain-containing protein [Acidobacteriota bacterium]
MTYRTPGVYVEEISTLPPSVAEVSTAIPAFLGCTEKGPAIARVNTMLEFEQRFGGPDPQAFDVFVTDGDGTRTISEIKPVPKAPGDFDYRLYHAVRHYFQNGGGGCWIVSVGGYGEAPAQEDFLNGLARLEKEDEPTLIVLTDAVGLGADDYFAVCQQALAQCNDLGDRFAILDVPRSDRSLDEDVEAFREGVGSEYLKYGAAYLPYLMTSISVSYDETSVTVLTENAAEDDPDTLDELETKETALYQAIRAALVGRRIVLPPSAAVAGIYASVDRDRGVWKAPANVSVAGVVGPVEKITHGEQEKLNIDPTGGKSINAIRAFTGRGTLVWGARTLAGNDNEWRYINVRRLFNLIEESVQNATAFAVFEPNGATTWLKVKGMIESYLFGLWERGALAGSTPEAAYFVNVGLNKTMTPRDVLEGRMIVEIGVAAVRPAEFIILRFTHKLQEA